MVETADFRTGLHIIVDGEIHTIVEYQQSHQGRGSAIMRAKLRRMRDGSTRERTFKSGERFESAFIGRKKMQLLYQDGDDYVLMDTETYDQQHVPTSMFGDQVNFMKDSMEVQLLVWNDQLVGVEIPEFMELTVTETDPNFRGDTASGGGKPATLETGAVVTVPFHINVGDLVKANTRLGTYIERIKKA